MRGTFLTGARGFAGSNFKKRLEKSGKILWTFEGDIRVSKSFEDFDRCEIDTIFNFAGRSRYSYEGSGYYDMWSTNVSGAVNCLEFARKKKCRVVLFSSFIYGAPQYLPVDETHPVLPHNDYAISKMQMEMIATVYREKFNLKVIVLRLFNLYGPGQKPGFLIPDLVNKIKKEPVVELMNSDSKRDFIYIDDFTDLLIKINQQQWPEEHFIFNVGTGRSYSVKSVFDRIAQSLPSTVKYRLVKGNDCISDAVANSERVQNAFSWTPRWELEAGLKKVLKHRELSGGCL